MFYDINEGKRYMCLICGVANDPTVYAMEKHNGRWYHWICLEKAKWFFLNNFIFELDEHLQVKTCKKIKKHKY